ncbi:MAG: macro domain-containing protein [Sciscionella sp.]
MHAREVSDELAPDTVGDRPRLVLCAVDHSLADAWQQIVPDEEMLSVHAGSVLDAGTDAVVSPANSHGSMRGGIDAVYAKAFFGIEERVRSAILTYHGGELPVGEALVVPTGTERPPWLISAPTMREPAQRLPSDTVHPFLAARAVFRLWANGRFEDGAALRTTIGSIALPGLGTGVGGVAPATCARQVLAAWHEIFTPRA